MGMEENGGGLFFESPDNITFCLEKLFYVCRVYIQDQSINNFENDTMKVSVNEATMTRLWARNWAAIQLVLISKFAFAPENFQGFSRNGPWGEGLLFDVPCSYINFVFIQFVNETVL